MCGSWDGSNLWDPWIYKVSIQITLGEPSHRDPSNSLGNHSVSITFLMHNILLSCSQHGTGHLSDQSNDESAQVKQELIHKRHEAPAQFGVADSRLLLANDLDLIKKI